MTTPAVEAEAAEPVLRLRDDWDVPIQPPLAGRSQVGHFVGRTDELERLVAELLRSPSKSILVSGHRGVGKTSLVYRALNQVLQPSANTHASDEEPPSDQGERAEARGGRSTSFLCVLQNAAQLEVDRPVDPAGGSFGRIEPKQILVNLIRRLYTASVHGSLELSEDVQRQIGDLYEKATASEVRIVRYAERRFQESHDTEERQEATFNLSGVSLRDSILAGAGLTIILQLLLAPSGWWEKALALAPLLILPMLTFAYQRIDRQATHEEQSDLASDLYAFDSSIGNLEFDLEAIHRSLEDEGVRAVYVIDELDKLEDAHVDEILKYFKNLFTLSSAVFIFVAGEELFRRLQQGEPSEGGTQAVLRGKEYTYFSSKYFLSRPSSRDIDSFLSAIVDSEDIDPERFELWKRAVAFDARGDYFDLIQVVRDRVTVRDGTSSVELTEPSAEDLLRSSLQGALTIVFDDSYRVSTPSRSVENDMLLRSMYDFAHGLLSLTPGTEFSDDQSDSLDAAAKRDLSSLLNRMGILNVEEEAEVEIRGLTVRIRTYAYAPRASKTLPEGLRLHSEIEQRFLEEFDRFWNRVCYYSDVLQMLRDVDPQGIPSIAGREGELVDELASVGFDPVAVTTFEQLWPAYQRVRTSLPPYPETREEIEGWSEDLATANSTMRGNAPVLLGRLVASVMHPEPDVNTLTADPDLYGADLASLSDGLSSTTHAVLVNAASGKRALISTAAGDDIVTGIRRAVRASKGKTRAVLVWTETRSPRPKSTPNISLISLLPADSEATAARLKRLSEWLAK
jgi:hypothetical protein